MKHRLGAAIIASAFVLSSSVLLGSNVNTTLNVKTWDSNTKVATGDAFMFVWVNEAVRHVPATAHGFIANPFEVAPGPCRAIAIEWNIAVFMNRPNSTFEKLLGKAAKHDCRLAISHGTTANQDGSFDLISAAPAK